MSQARENPLYPVGVTAHVTRGTDGVEYSRDTLQGYTIPQLKDILKKQGKKVGGNKAEIIDRIIGVAPIPISVPAPVASPTQMTTIALPPNQQLTTIKSPLPTAPTIPLTPIVAGTRSPSFTSELVNYNRYTDIDLINLGRNMYGADLGGMNRDAMIQWFTEREKIQQPPIVGAGPQSGALSPIVTSPTQLPMLPALPPAFPVATTVGSPAPVLPGTTLPVLPGTTLPVLPGTTLPIPTFPSAPIAPVVTSPPTSTIQLQPMPTVILPPVTVLPPVTTAPQPTVFPMGVLPHMASKAPQQITQQAPVQLPPVPPPAIQVALSPQPIIQLPPIIGTVAPVPVIVGGLGPLPTELPPITTPATALGLGTMAVTGMGINMPVVPTVVPPQAIRLPSPSSGIPIPIPIPRPANIPPPQAKVGPGGLNIDTDLATLNQLRSEINTAVNINPQAAFQKKIPAPTIGGIFLPPLPNVPITTLPQPTVHGLPYQTLPQPTGFDIPVTTLPNVPALGMTAATMPQPMIPTGITSPMARLPPLTGITLPKGTVAPSQPTVFQPLPQIITSPAPQPAVVLPGLTVALPTVLSPQQPTAPLPIGRATGAAPQIHFPKIKETAAVPQGLPQIQTPRVPGVPTVRLPTTQTVMQPVALTSPAAIPEQEETGLAVAYTPQQQVVENITQIDTTRLNAGRAKKDDNSYTVVQLRAIAGSLNLAKSGNKKDLVERIKAKMLSINPNAFNQ